MKTEKYILKIMLVALLWLTGFTTSDNNGGIRYRELSYAELISSGKKHITNRNYDSAQVYLVYAVAKTESEKMDASARFEALMTLGSMYHSWEAYKMASQYFLKSLEVAKELSQVDTKEVEELVAQSYQAQQDYDEAKKFYQELAKAYEETGDYRKSLSLYNRLSAMALEMDRIDEAARYASKHQELAQRANDPLLQAEAHNNIGYIYDLKQDNDLALQSYEAALHFFNKVENEAGVFHRKVNFLNNLGAAHTFLKQYDEAQQHYEEVLSIYYSNENVKGIAATHNFLAANAYVSGRSYEAIIHASKSAGIARENGYQKELLEAYNILSEAYRLDEDFKKSQEYYQEYQKLKDNINREQLTKKEGLQAHQIYVERKENELRTQIAEAEKQALALQQLKLEKERQEQELALVKQQQELQEERLKTEQLEKVRVAQALAFARQQLDAQKKQQAIDSLEKAQELQSLALRQKELEEKEKEKAIKLLESEKKIQEQQLKQEAGQKKVFIGGMVVVGFFLLFVLFALRQRSKAAKKLKLQQEEIKEKNDELTASEEELRQNMEELQTTQEVLAEQKETLEIQFQKMHQSIEYAQTIQNAILPTSRQRMAIFPESFLIYKPKDVVSGDFYWCSEHEDEKLVSVIDCTGHGVPGALMSMVGNNILNEVILQQCITDPGMVLTELNKGVRKKLSQEEGANKDGMDLGMCRIKKNNGKYHIDYSGAKHKLFVKKAGEQVTELKSDRKSIGGTSKDEHIFSTEFLELSAGDILYLTTDGYIDQSNAQRKSFSARRFKQLIDESAHLDMPEQEQVFKEALEKHMIGSDQRDDITLLAIKLD